MPKAVIELDELRLRALSPSVDLETVRDHLAAFTRTSAGGPGSGPRSARCRCASAGAGWSRRAAPSSRRRRRTSACARARRARSIACSTSTCVRRADSGRAERLEVADQLGEGHRVELVWSGRAACPRATSPSRLTIARSRRRRSRSATRAGEGVHRSYPPDAASEMPASTGRSTHFAVAASHCFPGHCASPVQPRRHVKVVGSQTGRA